MPWICANVKWMDQWQNEHKTVSVKQIRFIYTASNGLLLTKYGGGDKKKNGVMGFVSDV